MKAWSRCFFKVVVEWFVLHPFSMEHHDCRSFPDTSLFLCSITSRACMELG
jgi:hypothetical protein